ncbi:MAG: hypothetical protein ACJ74H_17140 [Thermoanaerobaculia bacterium]
MKNTIKTFAIFAVVLLMAVPMHAAGKKTAYDAPTVSCAPGSTGSSINITVTAGASGAPAGFSVQWVLQSELDANGGIWPLDSYVDPNLSSFCKASFSGKAYGYNYAVPAGGSNTVAVGDVIYDTPGASSECENTPLHCGERYAFRAFAHATNSLNRSAFSNTTTCSTIACANDDGCTYTQGYWKSHGPIPLGNNSNEWPVTSLDLGGTTYSDLDLLSILNTPGAGNGLVTLAHQLIAAKLNVANGANDSAIAASIAAADALIGTRIVPPLGSGSLPNSATSGLIGELTSYNEGATGPGHCP